MIRCGKCRGLGEYAGMGGIMRECIDCGGVGKIDKVNHAIDIFEKPVDKALEIVPVVEVIAPVVIEPVKKKEVEVAEILDEMTQACLDEPKMTTEQWRAKYPSIASSSNTRERHDVRVSYATRRVAAPRKVDLGAMQDDVVRNDADYIAFENKEKARLAKEEAKKAVKK